MRIPKSILVITISLGLAACNFPGTTPEATSPPEPTDQPTAPTDEPSAGPVLVSVDTSDPWYLACPDSSLEILANFEQHPSGIQNVIAHYRWNGGGAAVSDWAEFELTSEGTVAGNDQFRLTLPDAGSQAGALFGDQSGAFEYQLTATANAGGSTQWPPNNEVFILPVDPCSDVRFIVDDYGVSSTTAGYGPGCSPAEVTFQITLRGVSRVESAWLEYSFTTLPADPQILPDEIMVDLEGPTPVLTNPGAVMYTYTIDMNIDALAALNGQGGVMFWNGYIRTDDGMVFEYPQGGPPEVAIEACTN